jgi:hypothetical protein
MAIEKNISQLRLTHKPYDHRHIIEITQYKGKGKKGRKTNFK